MNYLIAHILLYRRALLEVFATALIVSSFSFFFPRWSEKLFSYPERLLSRWASHRILSICILFLSVCALRLSLLPLLPVPVPRIHDEFSYLLMADTFAHGRLANPTHPLWISFETFHVNWFPTYSSIYPPAQGLILAVGQLLGHPWIGVLLSDAAMCAAILWMLLAWMPARWALLGALLAAAKFGVASYWMNSYWGGAVAAIGGALVLGAMARISRRPAVRDAIILGIGLTILAASRPYEGFLFCIPVAIWFLFWLAGKSKSPVHAKTNPRTRFTRVVIPVLAVLSAAALASGYYNWRLTGNPLLMPHVLRTRTYHSSALFLWQHPRPPLHYNNQIFEDFYNGWERDNYRNTWADVRRVSLEKLKRGASTYFWWGALLLLPALPFALKRNTTRLLVAILAIEIAGVFAVIWSFPHYAAPLTSVLIALLVQCIRYLRTMRLARRPLGRWIARAAVLLLFMDVATGVARRQCDPLGWTCEGNVERATILKNLLHTPGAHLVMVRYEPDHNVHDDWVANGAEIDTSKVLWARELDENQNRELFDYFKDRHIWLVEPDVDTTVLRPYAPPEE